MLDESTAAAHTDGGQLRFRKQYILGPLPLDRPGWTVVRVAADLFLTAHPDLRIVQSQRNGAHLVLLGYILDPYAPEASDQQVLDGIAERSQSFADVILHTYPLSGRWVIIHSDGSSVRAFGDVIGSRQIYYTRSDGRLWCAAQPALLATQLELTRDGDPLLQEYVHSVAYEQNQRFWPGAGTIYRGVLHLLPNHSLDVRTGAVVRFWPNEALGSSSWRDAAPIASQILIGSLQAAARRGPLMLTVTAGLDSRMVLAASRPIASGVYYFVQRLKSAAYAIDYDADPDINVPSHLVKRLGFDFHVLESTTPADREFSEAIDASVTMARDAQKPGLYALRGHEGKLRVIGQAAEIARDKHYEAVRRQKLTAKLLAGIEHAGNAYAELSLAEWLRDADGVEEKYGVSLLDLFRWEQKFGNWTALGSAEGDVIGEELAPFANRKLLTTMLSVDLKHRTGPNWRLHRQMMRHMWAETLTAPINPVPLPARVSNAVKGVRRRLLGNTPIWTYLRARTSKARLSQYSSRAVTPATPAGNEADPDTKAR